MTPLAVRLRDEIAREGPISFRRFMECALYDPEHGYYRRPRDPFGAAGDFYTAEQIQPVFGILIAARVREWYEQMGRPGDFRVVELGSGRGEMAQAFAEWEYLPVDVAHGALPEKFRGVVFSNEFFDALPVEVAVRRGAGFAQMRVAWDGTRFVWHEAGPVTPEIAAYLERFVSIEEEGTIVEVNPAALEWMERIARSLESGYVLTIDYGYTRREQSRFTRGTLMSYRRHQALEDVLAEPGERDITAHVAFTALEEHGRACGLAPVESGSLARLLLAIGERDNFAAALASNDERETSRRTQGLKTLLFSMGDMFRVLVQRKEEGGQK